MNRYLLDCTLRDGGYVNDWKFGADNIAYLFERQVSSGADVIELGFLNERRTYDPDRTIQPDTQALNRIFGGLEKGNALTVAMIDYGTCSLPHIQPQKETCIDGIRVIFKKEKMREAIAFCREVKALGYRMFVQAVSITSYNDEELLELMRLVNDCMPYAMSMVDTYGLLDAKGLAHIRGIVNENLDRRIILGYHAHNNFQLGYANAVSFMNEEYDRDILIDGTLYGMGKSAGNAPIELIAMYMNSVFGKKYDVLQMQEAISTCILDIYNEKPWGYTLFYYIAAANRCHPDYVAYLMNKRTLSVSAINEILSQIPEEEKLGKNMKLMERLYLEYQKTDCDDAGALAELRTFLSGKEILMIGPGPQAMKQKEKITGYIAQHRPCVIAINYLPKDIPVDSIFLTNSKRYSQLAGRLPKEPEIPVIATSNVRSAGGRFPYTVNFESLIDENADFPDNSMVMLLKLIRECGAARAVLAGFDGYSPDDINYFDRSKEYNFVKEKAESLNGYARDFIAQYRRDIPTEFLTESYYEM